MQESALFSGLNNEESSAVLGCAHPRSYAKNAMLFFQGHPVTNLVFIQKGSVKLTQISPDGNEAILWVGGSGDIAGVNADNPGVSHSCSARAMETCRALVWEYRKLQGLGTAYMKISDNMSHMLSMRLRELEERFCEIATENAAKRLALGFLRLVKSVGKRSNEGFQIGVMREELAQLTGSTPFTISRILARWSDLGVVILSRNGIVIPDPEKLRVVDDHER